MKKALSLILALALCMGLLAVPAAAEPEFEIDNNGQLTKYNGPGGDVVIPDGVTVIAYFAFRDRTDVTSVVIPDGVTEIGMMAFSGCTGLTRVDLPGSVTVIDTSAFSGCTGLTRLDIPDGVTEIRSMAFSGCTGLKDITVPSSVTQIGGDAFSQTPWLDGLGELAIVNGILLRYSGTDAQVVIPDGVTVIGDSAFAGNFFLTSVVIPDGVTRIKSLAFDYCGGLTDVRIPDSVTEIDSFAFAGTPWLEAQGELAVVNGIVLHYAGSAAEVELPAGVKAVAGHAFSECAGLEKLVLPDGLIKLQSFAVSDCKALKQLFIPASVTEFGLSAVDGCSGLTDIYYGGTEAQWRELTGGRSFFGKAELHYGYTSGGADEPEPERPEFEIGTVTYNEWINSIFGSVPVERTTLLRYNGKGGDVVVPDEVEAIGEKAFYGCLDVTSVVLPEGVRHIVNNAFYDCSSMTSITIPKSLRTVGNFAFLNCSSLKSIELPDSVYYMGSFAFSGCIKLTNATFPDNPYLKEIPMFTFSACSGLTKVFIPETVTSIGSGAFSGCSRLTDIYYGGSETQWKNVSIGKYDDNDIDNDALKTAAIHYNCSGIMPTVVLSRQNLTVDGVEKDVEKYNIDGSNYFKLRDLALLLSGTGSQFSVGWIPETRTVTVTTGAAYAPVGGELAVGEDKSASAVLSPQTLLIDGVERSDLSAFNIGGNNFFKLRDLGEALGFDVDYDQATNTAAVISR